LSPDYQKSHAGKLLDVQKAFLRRMLRVGSRSIVSVLYTETGVMPLLTRRYLLCVRYLAYLLSLPQSHLARRALNAMMVLEAGNHRSWIRELREAGANLGFVIPVLDVLNASEQSVENHCSAVVTAMETDLQQSTDGTDKLYLIQGRNEPPKGKTGSAKPVVSCLRHYLRVDIAPHRDALTRILLSEHLLAVERLRWSDHAFPSLPRHRRLCRLCGLDVETPEHALLTCGATRELVDVR
ncbi:hypothetical protein BDZ89DRAFT_893282, partial [Hymenopellis radicata]